MAPGGDLLVCATTTRYLKKLENTKNKVETKKRNSEETHFFDNLKIRFFFLAQVPKCLYRVRAGEALVDIALKFGTSWLQVFLFFDSPPFSFLHIHTHLVVSGFYLHQRSLYLCMCVCVCMFRVGTPTSAHAPTHTHTHSHTLPAPPPPSLP